MQSVTSLWLPIVASAVIVFLLSWLMHMLLPYHRSDFRKLPAEDDVMDALRKFNIPPGEYMVPRCANPAEMRSQGFLDKLNKGPVAIMTVMKNGPFNMGASLTQWFLYCVLIGALSAYVASRAVGADHTYLHVFRFVGCTAFIGYSIGLWQNSIWYKRSWGTTLKFTFDGLVYALMTAGTFGWLWPKNLN